PIAAAQLIGLSRLPVLRRLSQRSFAPDLLFRYRVSREPRGDIQYVTVRVRQGFRHALEAIARLLGDEAGAARPRVPIIVREVVEGTFGNCRSAMLAGLECDRDVEVHARHPTLTLYDQARAFSFGNSDVALMRVRRQEADRPGWRSFFGKHGMCGSHDLDFLEIAVRARMVVRP